MDAWSPMSTRSAATPWAPVALADTVDVERAVTAAPWAFDDGPWPRMSPEERGLHLTPWLI